MRGDFVDKVNHKSAATPEAVSEAVHAVMHALRGEQYRAVRGKSPDITHMEGRLLDFCSRRPRVTLRDLTAHFGRDKGQMARLVKTLKARGLLLAARDRGDRRSILLRLSPEGRAVQRTLRRQWRRLARLAVAGIGDRELRSLVALLRRMQANLARRG